MDGFSRDVPCCGVTVGDVTRAHKEMAPREVVPVLMLLWELSLGRINRSLLKRWSPRSSTPLAAGFSHWKPPLLNFTELQYSWMSPAVEVLLLNNVCCLFF